MLTLTTTMLTTFGDGSMSLGDRKLLLGMVGGLVCAAVIVMAIFMIVQSTKQLRILAKKE
jgi:hypothetical protein